MPFDLDKCINDVANSTSFTSVFNNPIYTSLIIVFIVMIIIYFMFYDNLVENEFWTLIFRTAFYITIPVVIIVFLHYRNIEREFECRVNNTKISEVVQAAINKTPALIQTSVP